MPNTQGMGAKGSGLSFTAPARNHEEVGPMPFVERTAFTPLEQLELKALIKEALHEYIQERAEHHS
jgi:hypothetical protein